jgi:lipopolysaccharide export system protein LptA
MRLMGLIRGVAAVAVLLTAGSAAMAQSTTMSFGDMALDPDVPIEMSADTLNISQPDGTATFTGNVLVVQGELRITAGAMQIEYVEGSDGERTRISRLLAEGGVTVVTPAEAAEAREAIYSIADETIVLSGDVLLTQGPNAISGQTLTIDLAAGTGTFEGRVRTVLQAGSN